MRVAYWNIAFSTNFRISKKWEKKLFFAKKNFQTVAVDLKHWFESTNSINDRVFTLCVATKHCIIWPFHYFISRYFPKNRPRSPKTQKKIPKIFYVKLWVGLFIRQTFHVKNSFCKKSQMVVSFIFALKRDFWRNKHNIESKKFSKKSRQKKKIFFCETL